MVYTNKSEYLEYLIEEYSDTVYRLAVSRTRKKDTADDVYQEVFLRLARKIPEFDNKEHEKAWIIRVTINCSKNILTNIFLKNTAQIEEDVEDAGINILDKNDEKSDVYGAVQELPLKYRTVIYLFYYEGYKIEEIGKILGQKENTVKSQLLRAREKLKLKIEGGVEDEQKGIYR